VWSSNHRTGRRYLHALFFEASPGLMLMLRFEAEGVKLASQMTFPKKSSSAGLALVERRDHRCHCPAFQQLCFDGPPASLNDLNGRTRMKQGWMKPTVSVLLDSLQYPPLLMN